MSDNPNNLSPPTLDLLCHELRDIVEWRQLAINLKVRYSDVITIEIKYNYDVTECRMHALQKWLQQVNTVHSWHTVANAVKNINPSVAERIKKNYAPIIDEISDQSILQGSNNDIICTIQRRDNNCMARKNAKLLLIISLLLAILVVTVVVLIVLFIRLLPISALTNPKTGVPMSASSMSSIFPLSFTNTVTISSTLVTSSSISSSLSPTLSVSYANTIMTSSILVTSSSISSSLSPTLSVSYANTIMISSILVTSSSISLSLSPTLSVSYANTIMTSSILVTSSSISFSLSPTPSPKPGNAN